MKYVQILDGIMCTSDIDSCCSDYGIANYIYMIKQALNIIHFVVPVILIVMAAIQLFKMVTSPDDPQGKKMKSLLNKFIAAVLVFFIPFIVDLAVGIIPDSFSVSSCWESADDVVTLMRELEDEDYDPFKDNRKPIGDTYDEISKNIYTDPEGNSDTTTTNNATTNDQSSTTEVPSGNDDAPKKIKNKRKKVVEYAKKFEGNPYVYGGNSLTEGTDCSGFVKLVYAKFGYTLKRTSKEQAADSTYKNVKLSDVQPGDLLFYNKNGQIGHVSMYIGNGKVIHASSPSTGIKISNYGYRTPVKAKRIIAYES